MGAGSLIDSFNICAEQAEALVDILVAPVNLFNILDGAFAFRTQGGDQQSHPCPDIGTAHGNATQLTLTAKTNDGGAMGITQNDLGAHIH